MTKQILAKFGIFLEYEKTRNYCWLYSVAHSSEIRRLCLIKCAIFLEYEKPRVRIFFCFIAYVVYNYDKLLLSKLSHSSEIRG